jgi:hypothetical protein
MKDLHIPKADPAPDFTRHMFVVIEREGCHKHNAATGAACFYIMSDHPRGFSIGICNSRSKRAGYVGKISDKSLRRNVYPKKRQSSTAA